MQFLFILLLLLADIIEIISGGEQKNYCNVCRAVVDEANWKISHSDPKKTVLVGSFRVDPQGNQKTKEKSYARSEGHIEEIFESICEQMNHYAEMKQDDESTSIVRTLGRNGKRLDISSENLILDTGKRLIHMCHDFLENHEDVVMGLLQKEGIESYEKMICGTETEVCSGKELSTPMIELPEVEEKKEAEDSEGEEEESKPEDKDQIGQPSEAEKVVDGNGDESSDSGVSSDSFQNEEL